LTQDRALEGTSKEWERVAMCPVVFNREGSGKQVELEYD